MAGNVTVETTHVTIEPQWALWPQNKQMGSCSPREVGLMGEHIAATYLDRCGFDITDRNWRCEYGEADIVCASGRDCVVLVEVKTRLRLGGIADDAPELAVGPAKRRRYRNIALRYIGGHPNVSSIQFDVVAVVITSENDAYVRHISNAFAWDD